MHTNEFFSWGGTASRYGRRSSLDGIWKHDDKCLDGASAPIALEEPGKLDADALAGIVAAAPLVAIDLIVEDPQGDVLLGLRRNPPAQGCWFVPGGLIRKGETLDAAFARIACDELGRAYARKEARFVGVFEHGGGAGGRGAAGAAARD